jgi:CHASE2 domain-containing sensor protein
MYGYHCVVTATSYDCGPWPPQDLEILLVTVAGAVAGLLAWRLRRSMTKTQKTLMMAAIWILLAVLVVAWIIRLSAWSCHPDAFCQHPDSAVVAT